MGAEVSLAPVVQIPSGAESYLSADNRFQLVMEEPTEKENPLRAISSGGDDVEDFTVAMYAMEKSGGRLLWRSRYKAPYPLFLSDVIVAPEGDFFVTLPRTSTNGFVRTKETARPFKIESRLIASKNSDATEEQWADTITTLEKEPEGTLLRIWNSHQGRWTVFKMPSAEPLAGSSELTNRWNEVTRKKILALFAAEQSATLRRKLESLSPALERISAKLPDVRGETPLPVHGAFLAARRVPEDRTLFEQMLKKQETRTFFVPAYSKITDWKEKRSFVSSDLRRLQADQFLALWNGKVAKEKNYLGGAKGTVQLPAPILRNPGAVHIFLIPEGAERGKWIERIETESLQCDLREPSETDPDLANEIFFAFETVAPGNYFVKAIWDRRPPYAEDKGQQSAGPGDYESKLNGPITITAGQTTSNLVLNCSMQATKGSSYYAADKLAYEKWKSGNLSPAAVNPGKGR